MKRGGIGWRYLAIAILLLGGCGGYTTTSSDLSESEEGGGTGGGGTGISNTFASPAEMAVGDIMPIEFQDSTEVSISFSGVSSDAAFILALGSSNTTGSGTSMQLSADIALPEPDAPAKAIAADTEGDGFGTGEIFDAWLRASEDVLPLSEAPAAGPQGADGPFKAMNVKAAALGESETFRVLSSLSSTTSYVDVTGRVRCVGSSVAFYVDAAIGEDILPDADIQELCGEFDAVASAEQSLLGGTSDVDGDGKLHILMTKQINRLGALGGGIITGYFYAGDLYERSGSNPVSNHREVIYTMVPDPNGQYGTVISNAFAMSNLLPAVIPHELQHAISYNQHVLENGGMPEENWLNEGMSHLIEDVMGYGLENPARYAMYLASPSSTGLVTQGSPNLLERGAAYLFLRFLYEQASNGSTFLRALEATSSRGVDNLESAFGGAQGMSEFSEFIARWSTALAMTDRGISQDTRYVYRPRARNSSTGSWEGVVLSGDAEDNRGTSLDGVHLNSYYGYQSANIDASAVMFFNMTTLPNTMTLAGTQGGGNFGVLIRAR